MVDVYFIEAAASEEAGSLDHKVEALYDALAIEAQIRQDSFVALKLHFGEKGNTGYIRPEWLSGLAARLTQKTRRAFFTDTNTLYVGNRSNASEHLKLAWEHGYSQEALGIPVWIADGMIGRDDDEIEVDLPRIRSAKIASTFLSTDVLLCFSHFTGHVLSGVGAALKNLGMGCASRAGKLEQHSDVHPWVKSKKCTLCSTCFEYCPTGAIVEQGEAAFIQDETCIGCGECLVVCPTGAIGLSWDVDKGRVQEKIAEYAYCVHNLFEGRAGYFNFLVRMTRDCDCMSKDAPSFMEDIGILASRDPVALDKASVDLVNARAGKDIMQELQPIDWSIQLRHAEEIGLGSMEYDLKDLSLDGRH
ncbi:MAG: DUF362 domain-containing protein [Candidatus Aminicenantaceae bacterium]